MKFAKHCIFILSVFIISSNVQAESANYTNKRPHDTEIFENHNIEIIGKFGLKNKRNIGQIGLLVPLFSDYDKLFYLPIFGMLDNQHSKELNIGLGFRKIFNKNTIHGVKPPFLGQFITGIS